MQKLIETLKGLGIEIPSDKQAEVEKALSEHYKNAAEHSKVVSRLEADRDSWKQKAETAEQTLKKFDGIEPENIQREIADWKKKAEDAEENAKKQIYDRDFSDALKTELESIRFTSEAARKSIMAEIKESGLKLKEGKILGLSDLIEQIKKRDSSAFVDEEQEKLENNKARFTDKISGGGRGTAMTKDDIMAIKDRSERREAIKANMELFSQ